MDRARARTRFQEAQAGLEFIRLRQRLPHNPWNRCHGIRDTHQGRGRLRTNISHIYPECRRPRIRMVGRKL